MNDQPFEAWNFSELFLTVHFLPHNEDRVHYEEQQIIVVAYGNSPCLMTDSCYKVIG